MSGIENLNELLDEPIETSIEKPIEKEKVVKKSTKEKKIEDNKLVIGLMIRVKNCLFQKKVDF